LTVFYDSNGYFNSTKLEHISASVFVSHILRQIHFIGTNTLGDIFPFLKSSCAKDILVNTILQSIPTSGLVQKHLPKIVNKTYDQGGTVPLENLEGITKSTRINEICDCIDRGTNTTANARDWRFIYGYLGNISCSLIPLNLSSSPDYLLYLGSLDLVFGIQQKSNQIINSKRIAEEATKFNPVTDFRIKHILLIIGFGEIDNEDITKKCENFQVQENGTFYFPPNSTLKYEMLESEVESKSKAITKGKEKIDKLQKQVDKDVEKSKKRKKRWKTSEL